MLYPTPQNPDPFPTQSYQPLLHQRPFHHNMLLSLGEDNNNVNSEIIDLSRASEADKALTKPFGSTVTADLKHAALTPEMQALIEINNK